jgi:hypothetical protein
VNEVVLMNGLEQLYHLNKKHTRGFKAELASTNIEDVF